MTGTKIVVGSAAVLGLGAYLKFSVRPTMISYHTGRRVERTVARLRPVSSVRSTHTPRRPWGGLPGRA